jgi:hypothetical protein
MRTITLSDEQCELAEKGLDYLASNVPESDLAEIWETTPDDLHATRELIRSAPVS